MATTGYTIEEYLKGLSTIAVPDETISALLADAEVAPGTPIASLTKKQKELLKADLFVWLATTPYSGGSVEDANGVWRHKETNASANDSNIRSWLRLANAIYKKYGMPTVGSSGIKLEAKGFRLWSPVSRR